MMETKHPSNRDLEMKLDVILAKLVQYEAHAYFPSPFSARSCSSMRRIGNMGEQREAFCPRCGKLR